MIFLLIICSLLYLLMQAWIAYGWRQIPVSSSDQAELPPLSVVIAARNEAPNLKRFLPGILEQAYPAFEVILVLDRCEDESEQWVQRIQGPYPHLRVVTIASTPEGWSPKKWALSQGILQAQHPNLVLTDADCEAEDQWLQGMGEGYAQGNEFVLGLGLYRRYPGWLNRFIRWETFYAAFQYQGLARLGFPYMGVGRNLGYKKAIWEEHQGFEAFHTGLSGDDDLFVNAYAQGRKVGQVIGSGTRTISEPESRFGRWISQKVRHVSAAVRYSFQSQFMLSAFHLAHMGFFLAFFLSLVFHPTIELPILIYLGRISASWYIFGTINHKIREKDLLNWYPILDLLFFLFNLSIVPLGLIARPKVWQKNREYPKTRKKTESW